MQWRRVRPGTRPPPCLANPNDRIDTAEPPPLPAPSRREYLHGARNAAGARSLQRPYRFPRGRSFGYSHPPGHGVHATLRWTGTTYRFGSRASTAARSSPGPIEARRYRYLYRHRELRPLPVAQQSLGFAAGTGGGAWRATLPCLPRGCPRRRPDPVPDEPIRRCSGWQSATGGDAGRLLFGSG